MASTGYQRDGEPVFGKWSGPKIGQILTVDELTDSIMRAVFSRAMAELTFSSSDEILNAPFGIRHIRYAILRKLGFAIRPAAEKAGFRNQAHKVEFTNRLEANPMVQFLVNTVLGEKIEEGGFTIRDWVAEMKKLLVNPNTTIEQRRQILLDIAKTAGWGMELVKLNVEMQKVLSDGGNGSSRGLNSLPPGDGWSKTRIPDNGQPAIPVENTSPQSGRPVLPDENSAISGVGLRNLGEDAEGFEGIPEPPKSS